MLALGLCVPRLPVREEAMLDEPDVVRSSAGRKEAGRLPRVECGLVGSERRSAAERAVMLLA